MQALLQEIRAAYPSFAETLEALGDQGSAYSSMESFARFVIDRFEAGDREALRPAFDIIERVMVSGTEDIRDAVSLGFLEALQNIASHRRCGPTAFEPYLGSAARQEWDRLNEVWKGKETLAEVVASEQGISSRRRWWQFWRRRQSPEEMLAVVENPELRALIEGMTRTPRKK